MLRELIQSRNISLSARMFVETIIIFFGIWTIYCNIFSLWGFSLQTLSWFSILPVFVSFLVCCLLKKLDKSYFSPRPVIYRRYKKIPAGMKWSMALMIVVVFFITKNLVVLWVFSICYLCFLHLDALQRELDLVEESSSTRQNFVGVLVVAFLAAVVTLFAHRPDADDTTYLNIMVSALEFPTFYSSLSPFLSSNCFTSRNKVS